MSSSAAWGRGLASLGAAAGAAGLGAMIFFGGGVTILGASLKSSGFGCGPEHRAAAMSVVRATKSVGVGHAEKLAYSAPLHPQVLVKSVESCCQ